MTEMEKLKVLTGSSDEPLLSVLLDDAKEFTLSYTNRTHIPTGLNKTVRDLVVIAFNRLGTEGESGRSEAGESYTFNDAPKQIYDVLNQFRLAKVGGKAYEDETQQNEAVQP